MTFFRCVSAVALAIGLFAAETSGAASAPAVAAAPTESKIFGDWTVRCFAINSPSPCDMYQLLANKKTNQRVLSLSFAFLPSRNKNAMQISVPLGVRIQPGLIIVSDKFTSSALPFRRCDRAGCYVEMLVENGALDSLGASSRSPKIRVVAAGGRIFEFPFSLTGYADAHSEMIDHARKRAANPSGAQPAARPATKAAAPTKPTSTPSEP